MAKRRSVRPEFFEAEVAQSWPPLTRLAYIQLWGLVDDEGLAKMSLKLLARTLLPFDEFDIGELLEPMVRDGRLAFYSANEATYIWLPRFVRNQTFNHPKPSRHPHPERDTALVVRHEYGTGSVSAPSVSGTHTPLPNLNLNLRPKTLTRRADAPAELTLDVPVVAKPSKKEVEAAYVEAAQVIWEANTGRNQNVSKHALVLLRQRKATLEDLTILASWAAGDTDFQDDRRRYLRPETVWGNHKWDSYIVEARDQQTKKNNKGYGGAGRGFLPAKTKETA